MTELTKGANTVIFAKEQPAAPLLVTVSWAAGLAAELDASALVLNAAGKVLSEQHFVFFNNPETPDWTVIAMLNTAPVTPPANAQFLVNLGELPPDADKVLITVAALEDDVWLAQVQDLRLSINTLGNGADVASYRVTHTIGGESALILGELYRYQGNWKVRAVGQGYVDGLAGLARDFGVEIA